MQELDIWGPRELGRLGRLVFAGPRVKAVVDLQSLGASLAEFSGDAVAEWLACRLLKATHGGQVGNLRSLALVCLPPTSPRG